MHDFLNPLYYSNIDKHLCSNLTLKDFYLVLLRSYYNCSQESKTVGFSDQNEISYGTIQFEIPELDALLENACFTEMERMQMMCQTPEVENRLVRTLNRHLYTHLVFLSFTNQINKLLKVSMSDYKHNIMVTFILQYFSVVLKLRKK
ncbi:hypothetical protein Lalb_Chr19g0130851 [Lupinus albus]|uniref:Uncharacterized protein n=1 Tax=Lupinus albus TaxID=3870 RepID=A0A6A4P1T8_LUPAL|nr:hypothetical protein Lalb_Chr19g0130851 [Lupinus albus]